MREHVVFGGRIPPQPRGAVERAMAKNTPAEFHDVRDWEAVRSWAQQIAFELAAPPLAA